MVYCANFYDDSAIHNLQNEVMTTRSRDDVMWEVKKSKVQKYELEESFLWPSYQSFKPY